MRANKTLAKSYSADTVGQLLAVLDNDEASRHRGDWVERERAAADRAPDLAAR